VEEATHFIDMFIAEPFSGEERHVRRIAEIAEYERTGSIVGSPTEPPVAHPAPAGTALPGHVGEVTGA